MKFYKKKLGVRNVHCKFIYSVVIGLLGERNHQPVNHWKGKVEWCHHETINQYFELPELITNNRHPSMSLNFFVDIVRHSGLKCSGLCILLFYLCHWLRYKVFQHDFTSYWRNNLCRRIYRCEIEKKKKKMFVICSIYIYI